jgi:hypothetical protein
MNDDGASLINEAPSSFSGYFFTIIDIRKPK